MNVKWLLSGFAAICALGLYAVPTITGITAQQRYPWNGKVDIAVTLSGESNDVAKAECTFAATNCATSAALATTHITEVGMMSGSGTTWTRRFVWEATADVGEVKIADVAFYVEAKALLGGVQLWRMAPIGRNAMSEQRNRRNMAITFGEEEQWGTNAIRIMLGGCCMELENVFLFLSVIAQPTERINPS